MVKSVVYSVTVEKFAFVQFEGSCQIGGLYSVVSIAISLSTALGFS